MKNGNNITKAEMMGHNKVALEEKLYIRINIVIFVSNTDKLK